MHRALPVVLFALGCGRFGFDDVIVGGGSNAADAVVSDGNGDGAMTDVGAPLGWWDPAWHDRIKLTLGDPGAPLQNVPLLVHLGPARINYSKTAVGGADLRFVDADGVTVLPYEIDQWQSGGTSYVWVRVPLIDAGGGADHIWLYYGNATATAAPNSGVLWTGYPLAWHLDENPAAPAPQIQDSSASNYDGSAVGAMPAAAQSPGKIGGALTFDGTDDWITGPNVASLRVIGDITIIVWMNRQVASRAQWLCDFGTPASEQEGNNHLYELTLDSSNNIEFEWEYSAGNDELAQSTQALTTGLSQWTMIAVTRDVAANEVRFYENGSPLGNPVAFGNDPTGGATGSFYFAGMLDGTSSKQPFIGRLDEFRLEPRVRSATWIATQYRSMVDSFLSYGAPENY
jgi:hypothetical protein